MKRSIFQPNEPLILEGTRTFRFAHEVSGGLPIVVSFTNESILEKPATVQFSLLCECGTFYRSGTYNFGTAWEKKQWRIPPSLTDDVFAEITVTVPDGEKIVMSEATVEAQRAYPTWERIRFNAHLGFMGVAPQNTIASVRYAALSSFPACIVVPKVTKDGKFVFIHDDTINRTARDENGNPPSTDMAVADMTLDELQEWDFGLSKSPYYKGTRIPPLEDFFTICAESGMRPMFSTHPALTIGQWKQVRRMLEERKILDLFHIKSFNLNCLRDAYSVFGEEIEGYTWDHGDAAKLAETEIGHSHRRIGVELQGKDYTKEVADDIRAHGFFAAAYAIGRCGSEGYRNYIHMGLTEFTEDYHCSMGLNW